MGGNALAHSHGRHLTTCPPPDAQPACPSVMSWWQKAPSQQPRQRQLSKLQTSPLRCWRILRQRLRCGLLPSVGSAALHLELCRRFNPGSLCGIWSHQHTAMLQTYLNSTAAANLPPLPIYGLLRTRHLCPNTLLLDGGTNVKMEIVECYMLHATQTSL